MKEKRPLVATVDVGRDAHTAAALLQRHKDTHEQILAHRDELDALKAHAEKLKEAGITRLQVGGRIVVVYCFFLGWLLCFVLDHAFSHKFTCVHTNFTPVFPQTFLLNYNELLFKRKESVERHNFK